MSFLGQRVGSVHVEFAAALGLTDVGPVGGAAAGTGEAVGLHEGLQQERSVAVASLPVVRQAAAAASQHRGSEIAHLHPGQDQEAGVVHDQLQAGFALGNAPADEAVAGSRLPGAGAKADDRQHAPLAGDQVAHLCSRQRRIAEVVVAVHVLAPRRINPRIWLTEYLNACAVAGGRVPADFERFLPWNRRAARVPRASPAQVVDSRAA